MHTISEEPHHAGGPGSKRVAEYILSKFKSWGLTAWIEEFEALMPMPRERALELVEPESYQAQLAEPAMVEDKDSSDSDQLPTFNAYSADGDVTAQLVYVNYGIPEDYERLAEMGIDVRGKIVIARYGRSWRGIKAKLAWEHGAVACLIYSDPEDDGYRKGDTYPDGPFRPWLGVQRGSVMDMPIHPGDPLTPGWAAEKGARKLDLSEARTLVQIPVQPLSYADAMPFLKNLRGPVAPEEWQGALPVTYHVGPGPAKVHLRLSFDWQVRPIYNVLARIDGQVFPDQWIIHGNHHDSWVNGATDPTSGNVALMETARSLGELVKQGWRPKRTILFASWDGEEWGLLGSTEWAEKHAAELQEKAVVYINTDSTGTGWLSPSGSHSLQKFVNQVARDISDPRSGKNLRQAARERRIEQAKTDEDREKIEKRADLSIKALGSGSDYTAFLDHLTIASLNFSFGGASDGGVYHSVYDSFDWYTRFSDTTFEYGRALSQLVGTAILRLTDATLLPFHFTDYAETLDEYVEEIEKSREEMDEAPPLDLSTVRAAIGELRRAGEAYETAVARLPSADASWLESHHEELARLNRLLYTSERVLGYPGGLPDREWFRHQVYAPGYYTGYGVKTLPGIRESVEQKAAESLENYVAIVAQSIHQLAQQVNEAHGILVTLLQ
jgi:N-acetylated-alpha-linked acidic dipeptidase